MLEEERRSRVRVERIGEGEEDWAVGWENGGGKAEAQAQLRLGRVRAWVGLLVAGAELWLLLKPRRSIALFGCSPAFPIVL